MSELRTSEAGLKLIMAHEGFRSVSKQLPDGRWVIGYGHMKAAREGLKISQAEAEAILREFDLPPIEKGLNDLLLVPVSQNEFDALTSFAYNIGLDQFESSDVLAHINAGNKLKAAWAMESWRKARVGARDMVVDPLVRRRADEKALFLKTEGPVPLASSSRFRPLVDIEETERYRKQAAQRAYQAPGYPANDQTDDESSTEAAARSVKERLTRILGEGEEEDEETLAGEIDTDLEMVSDDDEKSVDDIRKAVSALAVNAPAQSADEDARAVDDGFLVMSADNDAGEAGADVIEDTPETETPPAAQEPEAAEPEVPAEAVEDEVEEEEAKAASSNSPFAFLLPQKPATPQVDKTAGETGTAEVAPEAATAEENAEDKSEAAEEAAVPETPETSGPEASEDAAVTVAETNSEEKAASPAKAEAKTDGSAEETNKGEAAKPAEPDQASDAKTVPELETSEFAAEPATLDVEEDTVRDERGRVIIDDLRPSDVWLSDGTEHDEERKEGPLETLVFGILALIGAGLFTYGGAREFGWFGLETASQGEMLDYLPPFLMLLGGLVFVVMAYYCIKAVFSKG